MQLTKQTIVLLSNEAWGDMWFSKHNYAFELSKKNQIIFINPAPRWSLKNSLTSTKLKEVYPNLWVLNYTNFIPALNKWLYCINDYLITKSINRFLKKRKMSPTILWSFDPFRINYPKRLRVNLSIYHIVDLYKNTHWGENLLIKNVDLGIFISKTIEEKYAPEIVKRVVIPHAISIDEFTSSHKPVDLPEAPYGLYVGTIDIRVDFDFVEKMVSSFSSIPFVFVGEVVNQADEAFLRVFVEKKYENVIILGKKPFKELKNYIYYAHFCFAFMRNIEWNNIAHHKTLLYLSMGKPIFCGKFSDYNTISNLLYMTHELEEMKLLFTNFLTTNENATLKDKRINYAKEHTFESALMRIENLINER